MAPPHGASAAIAAELQAKQHQLKLQALSKRKDREQSAPALNKPPPASSLRLTKKKQKQLLASSGVVKPHCTVNTPAKERNRATRVVTPSCPTEKTRVQPGLSNGLFHFEHEDDQAYSAPTEAFPTIDDSFLDSILQDNNKMSNSTEKQLQSKVLTMAAQLEDLQLQIRRKTEHILQQKDLLDSIVRPGENGTAAVGISVEAYKDQQKKLLDAKTNYQELLETHKNLQEQLHKSEEELTKTNRQFGVLYDTNKAQVTTISDLENKVRDLKSKLRLLEGASASTQPNEMEILAFELQVEDLKKERDTLQALLDGDTGTGGSQNELLQQKYNDLEKQHKALLARSNQMQQQRDEAVKLLNKAGKAAKFQVNKVVEEAAREFLKDVTFRKIKWVDKKNKVDVEAFMRDIYDGIKDDRQFEVTGSKDELPFDSFKLFYTEVLLKYTGGLRSTANTNCLNAMYAWYLEWGEIPTVDDILNKVYHRMPKENSEAYAKVKALKIWYFTIFLPGVLANNQLAEPIRLQYHICQHREICGKNRVTVESKSEGYGLFLLENNQDKAKNIAEEMAKDHKFKPPKYNKKDRSTYKFHKCKFTNSYAGQGSGIKKNAKPFLDDMVDKIVKIRDKDALKKFKLHKSHLKLLQEVSDKEPPTQQAGNTRPREEEDFEEVVGPNGKRIRLVVEADLESDREYVVPDGDDQEEEESDASNEDDDESTEAEEEHNDNGNE